MADLQFDLVSFERAINEYTEIAEVIESTKNDLVDSIESLKNTWDSDASKAFHKFYNDNWVSHVDLYVKVLNQLADLLRKARNEYQNLEEKVSKII